MFTDIRNEITRDFLDIKIWLSSFPDSINDSDFYIINRGLFFVYIYGIYEKIITKTVSCTISSLNNANVHLDECVYELYPLIFSNEYDGLYHVGNKTKWEKRWIISEKMIYNPIISIPIKLLPTDGRNIHFKQLESIAKSFGMKRDILPKNENIGDLEEMVNNRNYIAHGDKNPQEIGRSYTKNDLIKKCDIISVICSYIVDCYEGYITQHEYLKGTSKNL